MITFQRILSPVDFSDHSRLALDHAVAIARWYDSRITVLHVTPSPARIGELGYDAVAGSPAVSEDLMKKLDRFVDEETSSLVPVEKYVREGEPVTKILQMAGEIAADLLVMGSHGRSGFDRLLLGSVTEKALRRATCPVLVVPRRNPEAVPARQPLFRDILCATDFSESSLAGLAYAVSLATEADARLTLLHVISHEFNETDVPVLLAAADMGLSVTDFKRRREEEIRAKLNTLVPSDAADACRLELTVCRGKAWRTILKAAAEKQSDLIVMGVQGRGAADLMFMGSTTQHVLRQATCPVLTVRAL
jgi:nucleotide-binding universal stress UspA family protein